MNRETICFVQHASEHPLFLALADNLKERGYKYLFVCKTNTAHRFYEDASAKSFLVTAETFLMEDASEIEKFRIERDYGVGILRRIAGSDIHLWLLYKNDIKRQEAVVARSFLYWESLLKQESVSYIVGRETATFLTRPAYFVSKRMGIPYGQLILGPGPGLCVMCDVEEFHIWQELEAVLKTGSFRLSVKQKKLVDNFVETRLPKVSGKMAMRFVPTSLLKTLKQYFGMWWHDTRVATSNDPLYVAALRYGRYRLIKQLKWKYITSKLFCYAEVDDSDKIVYFPIYSGLETSYLTHTPQWAKSEVELILKVSRALPEGYTLYLKEHPHNPGDLSFSDLRRLVHEPNIKVVRPWVSSQYLIDLSSLIVVIQGTAGWEAFLSKRPVLCIEDVAFYGRSDLVYKVTDMKQLRITIATALAKGESIYIEHQEEWYWFINAILTTVGNGDIINLKPPYGGFVTTKENVNSVAAYIDKKIVGYIKDKYPIA